MKKILLSSLLALASTACLQAQTLLPPTMGWSSWNTYAAQISDEIIKRQADYMVSTGLDTVGYRYVNIDDGFFYNRDSVGNLVIHPTRFPDGLQPVVDYIHGLGLKAGIYTDAGHSTCASYYGGESGGLQGGILDHEDADCTLYFDSLGFDFIKVDFCGGTSWQNAEQLDLDPQTRYEAIGEAIARSEARTGRKVVYNVCRWDFPGTWVTDVADSWRISQDINASWSSVKDIIGQNLYLSAYCSRGHYNDMDMLEVGRGLSTTEDQTHFGLWCIMSSPLLIGCDLGQISTATRRLLGNEDLIALNQDTLGLQAYVATASGGAYVLVKDMGQRQGLTRAVALYNSTDAAVKMTFRYADVDLAGDITIRDLISKKETAADADSYSASVPAHGSKFLLLTATERLTRTRYEAETAYLSAYQELENNQSVVSAVYTADENCSGGEKVGWLGKKAKNDLQWRDVYVAEEGDYDMTIHYISGEDRTIRVSVNGSHVANLSCNSGGWSTVDSVTTRIHLQQGDNTVRLYNASAWMPDIDLMTLSPVVPAAISSTRRYDKRTATAYDLGGRPVDERTLTGFYIKDGEKHYRK